ncbi:hypothetical protein CK556_02645 [Mesoplasma chauliocola]|uniref:Uncharacterized protein n=1 Tax=Mesoplasma chauliocola TaxID=216427 RepID=A0A249SNK9_9MOLU|nr:hypothetical protein [Mesoplasma chauliocola]ASZ09238.1 hypothetical protein CK556_02645 [Mesoplasma chauliocola]
MITETGITDYSFLGIRYDKKIGLDSEGNLIFKQNDGNEGMQIELEINSDVSNTSKLFLIMKEYFEKIIGQYVYNKICLEYIYRPVNSKIYEDEIKNQVFNQKETQKQFFENLIDDSEKKLIVKK